MALLCFEFADVAGQGCHIFESIKELNEDYRSLVAREELDYDEALEWRIVELYSEWRKASLRAIQGYDQIVRDFKSRGFDTERIGRLRGYCDEATAILKDVAEWEQIESAALSSTRIDAVAAYLLSSGEAST